MNWWNELWLNESFATWVGWLAIDHFHPSHEVWSQFVTESMQTAQNLDSLRASHPIEVPVRASSRHKSDTGNTFKKLNLLPGCAGS